MAINKYHIAFLFSLLLCVTGKLFAQSKSTSEIDSSKNYYIFFENPDTAIAKLNTKKGRKATQSECSLADTMRVFINNFGAYFTRPLTTKDTAVITQMISRLASID